MEHIPADNYEPVPTDFETDKEARSYVNLVLERSWTKEGVLYWWDHPRHQLDNQTPNQVWAIDRQKVIELAVADRDQTGT